MTNRNDTITTTTTKIKRTSIRVKKTRFLISLITSLHVFPSVVLWPSLWKRDASSSSLPPLLSSAAFPPLLCVSAQPIVSSTTTTATSSKTKTDTTTTTTTTTAAALNKKSRVWSQKELMENWINELTLHAMNENKQVDGEVRKRGLEFVQVPPHFRRKKRDAILREVEHYKSNGGKWSERVVLEIIYHATVKPDSVLEHSVNWLNDDVDVCNWEGITCGSFSRGPGERNCESDDSDDCDTLDWDDMDGDDEDEKTSPTFELDSSRKTSSKFPLNAVSKIDMSGYGLNGTLPPELSHLKYLHRLNVNDNNLHGTIPTTYGDFEHILFLDFGANALTGTLPTELGKLTSLNEFWIEKNGITGTLPSEMFGPDSLEFSNLSFLDLSGNKFTGTLHDDMGDFMPEIETLYFENNMFMGSIPSSLAKCKDIRTIDFSSNLFAGTIPTELGNLTNLETLVLSKNLLNGPIPSEFLQLSNLSSLIINNNDLEGTFPSISYGNLVSLEMISFSQNRLKGTIPTRFGEMIELQTMDLKMNHLTGTIPSEMGLLSNLTYFDVSMNELSGSIPKEFGQLEWLERVNMTSNRLTGTIPRRLCANTRLNDGFAEEFGCDAVLCPEGTFHLYGAASSIGGCRKCPETDHDDSFLGQFTCPDDEFVEFLVGDIDGDGTLSQREAIRSIFTFTQGELWGQSYQDWKDMKVHECDLVGITCKNRLVTKIDLKDASLCAASDEDAVYACGGIPRQISRLENLEVLDLSRGGSTLKSTIPTELGLLPNLKMLDLSASPSITGTIPSELGNCSALRGLYLSDCGLGGTIPEELGNLKQLEKLNLSLNKLEGCLPPTIGKLERLREMLVSRAHLTGTLPQTLGKLGALENMELYGNKFHGAIPDTVGEGCSSLKRIDLFNNKLTGTIPSALVKIGLLQIVHLKSNRLTGTIPTELGNFPLLSWFDASSNELSGHIPSELGNARSLKDLRLGGNRLQSPVPESLCTNTKINNGRVRSFGCDAIACPMGTFSESGFATAESPCRVCPQGETTLYLGSPSCYKYTQRDFLVMFYDVMGGENWSSEYNRNWKNAKVSECEWGGVSCDENGTIDGLTFPLAGTSWAAENAES